MSYLPKRKIARGVRGDNKFLQFFENGQAKLKHVIGEIEDTGLESTLLALDTYADSGVPVELVSQMLRSIRTDLLDVDREFIKASEALAP
ncbi:MAG: hypothetical protein H0U60_18615 [Blastocatellia bacterium]|nr:hypothetical protein [Blastocatellia bacterium]